MTHVLFFTIKHSILYLRVFYASLAFTHASTAGRRKPITCLTIGKSVGLDQRTRMRKVYNIPGFSPICGLYVTVIVMNSFLYPWPEIASYVVHVLRAHWVR